MIKLPEDVKRVLSEQYEQRLTTPVTAVTLPCTKNHKELEPVVVHLEDMEPKVIVCPLCGTRHHLAFKRKTIM